MTGTPGWASSAKEAVRRTPVHTAWRSVAFAAGAAALLYREGVVPDPLVAGDAGPLAFLCMVALAALIYALAVGSALAARRRL